MLGVILNGWGFSVTAAEDALIAKEILQGVNFDLIIMDIRLPIMDGLAAIRMIRAQEHGENRAATPIIVISALASRFDKQASLEAGANAHLGKPIQILSLMAILNDLFDRAPDNDPGLPTQRNWAR